MSIALTIAGSDPSGGAGLQADLKTFHQCGVYGASVVTLLTVQNTVSVTDVQLLTPDFVERQFRAVFDDLHPQAIKTGALGSAPMIDKVADLLATTDLPRVIDPVMVSKHGVALMAESAIDVFIKRLLPLATILTPNRYEAARLLGQQALTVEQLPEAAVALAKLGAKQFVIKGGQRGAESVDLLYLNGRTEWLVEPWVDDAASHGTGCTFAAAITAQLAQGQSLFAAVRFAKRFVNQAIRSARKIGHGLSPINHHAQVTDC